MSDFIKFTVLSIYESFGTKFPMLSLAFIFCLGGAITSGCWYMLGRYYDSENLKPRQAGTKDPPPIISNEGNMGKLSVEGNVFITTGTVLKNQGYIKETEFSRNAVGPARQYDLGIPNLSKGRQRIVAEIVQIMGVTNVINSKERELIQNFSVLAKNIRKGTLLQSHQLNDGSLTGLCMPIPIVDRADKLTSVGAAILKQAAKRLAAGA